MYSPEITERELHLVSMRPRPKRQEVWVSHEITNALTKLIDPVTNQPKRDFTKDEKQFLMSETLLCQIDFRYWAERYAYIELAAESGGGIGLPKFWASQERALDLISKREEELWKEFDKHGFSDPLLTVWHKARQLGATAIMRLINMHRMLLHQNTRSMAASLDEAKVHELYVKDKVVLDNLPFFLKPEIEFDVKDQHISFKRMKSRMSYQQANQQAGIGTGSSFDVFHLTEVALWAWADRLKFDFFPTIGRHPKVFGAAESTANGRGNFWRDFSENVRRKEYGYESWLYIFAPYYIEPTRYRRAAPDDWTPTEVTAQHASMVERTSPDILGKIHRLTRDQMYWWESEREMFRKDGSLNVFLTNYCATPEESFQHSAVAALPIETIEWMRSTTGVRDMAMPYLPEPNPLRI